MASAPARKGGLAEPRDFLSLDDDAAAGRPVDSGDQVQQRRFAGTRRSHERKEIAARNIERDAVEHRHFEFVALVDLPNFFNLNECLHMFLRSSFFVLRSSLFALRFPFSGERRTYNDELLS